MDTCPNCHTESYDHHYLGAYNVQCVECGDTWNLREQHGLSPHYCECCYRPLSYGCGHTPEQEVEMLRHRDSTEHLLGDCDCFESRPGYIARFTREERRERVAEVLRKVQATARTEVRTVDVDLLLDTLLRK